MYYGAYELRELATVEGYELLAVPVPFSIMEHGSVIDIPVTNPLIYGGAEILKTDENGAPLSGAVFGLYNGQDQLISELTTDGDGRASISGLVMGGYYLLEHAAPEGFVPSDAVIPFSIATQGEVFEATVVNIDGSGTLRVIKYGDSEIIIPSRAAAERLAGVVFKVYRTTDDAYIAEIVTDEYGMAEITLPLGAYYLLETQTAEGYRLPEGTFSFTLTTHGETVELTLQNQKQPEEPAPVKCGLRLVKLAADTQEPLSGAVFGLYDTATDERVAVLTTDEYGVAVYELPEGAFYLLEQVAPEGFILSDDRIDFTLWNGETKEITVTNAHIPDEPVTPTTGYVSITKQAEGTGTKLAGAVFEVYDAATGLLITTLTTGADGTVSYELPAGGFYLLETQAPTGFLLKEGHIGFIIKAGETSEVTVYNTPIPDAPTTGSIRLTKKAEGSGALLSGAVFGVYDATTDIKAAEITTGADGTATTGELPAGSYYLLEHTAPSGFVLNTDKIGVVVNAGETAEVTVTNAPIPPAPTTGTIRLTKKAEGSGALLSGAVFGVYETTTDIKAAEITTGADGTATTGELPAGSYYLLERTAPSGFVLNTEKHGVTVKAGETAEITITNTKTPDSGGDATGWLRLVKQAEGTKKRLSGAVFGIFRASDNKKIAEITTDSDGVATYELNASDYYLRELKAPAGYTLDSGKIGFTITVGVTRIVTVTNSPEETETGRVRVTKLMEGTGAKLSGAVFGVYRASNDRKVAEITTGRDGTATYELEEGRYYLLELEAPTGMKLKTDKISFTVKAGETVDVTVYNTPKDPNAPAMGTLYLIKKAEGTGAKLPGAVFGVYKASDNSKLTEITTDADGAAVYELTPGDYYLRELKALDGFLLETAKIPFTIKADATVRVEVTNMKENGAGSVKLIKRGSDGEAVSGAVFGVYKASSGEKAAEITSGSDGTAVYTLAPGAYYLLEKSAPSGYALNTEKHSFTITSSQTVDVRVVNQRAASTPSGGIEIPKTGEPFPFGNYALSALFLCAAMLCGVMLYRGRGRGVKKA